jgi:anti-sigma28 factor (negative regulator of flagellin synthesis)
MSSINGLGENAPVQKITATPIRRDIATAAPDETRKITDRVELSGVQSLLDKLKSNDVRTDKVASIRAQIEAGDYETDQKLDIAADRMLDDLLK